jgi:hypothetical protein
VIFGAANHGGAAGPAKSSGRRRPVVAESLHDLWVPNQRRDPVATGRAKITRHDVAEPRTSASGESKSATHICRMSTALQIGS